MTKIKNQDESPLCNDRTLRDKCVNHYEVLEGKTIIAFTWNGYDVY